MAVSSYRINQRPPVKQWYRRRVGWFGMIAAALIVVGSAGVSGYSFYVEQHNKQVAAEKSAPHLEKVSAASLPETSTQNIVDLQPLLDDWAKQHPNQKWGIVAKSIEGPSFDASVNADAQFESASIYKLFLTLPLFNQIAVEHQSAINVTVGGQQKSIETCVDLMIRLSHNECGEAIGYYLNWTKAHKVLQSHGFTKTNFKSNNLQTSAGDTASFLQQLDGDMLTRNAKESVLRSMREQRWRDGIPAGCPGCVTANKTGSRDNVIHDAAIIDYDGGKYVLVVMSEKGNFKQIAELTGKIQQKIVDTSR